MYSIVFFVTISASSIEFTGKRPTAIVSSPKKRSCEFTPVCALIIPKKSSEVNEEYSEDFLLTGMS